jgi:hypothetical protein
MGTPMCGRDGPSACSAGDERHQREGRLQVGFGFGQIYALFLARYTPRFWLKYTPKRRFGKRGVYYVAYFLGVYYVAYIFMDLRSVSGIFQASAKASGMSF